MREKEEGALHAPAWAQELEMEKWLPFSESSFRNASLQTRGRDPVPLFPTASEMPLQSADLAADHPFLG